MTVCAGTSSSHVFLVQSVFVSVLKHISLLIHTAPGISRIPASSAALLPNKTVPVPGDEEYYIVGLNVFHELHCLNNLRMLVWPEHYGKRGLSEEMIDHLGIVLPITTPTPEGLNY